MKAKLIALLTIVAITNTCFAQQKKYADSLTIALNTIIATLPDSCKNLWGKATSALSYESNVALPRSVKNRFDISKQVGNTTPIIFMSYVPANDNKMIAIANQQMMDKTIRKLRITYKKRKYKIVFLPLASKMDDNPDYHYKLKRAPKELENVQIYMRLDASMIKGIYQYTMGVYVLNP